MPSGQEVGHSFYCTCGNDIFAEHSSAASLATYPVVISSSISVLVEMGGMPASYAIVSMVGYPYQNSIRDGSR
jgi:hypothetical protein